MTTYNDYLEARKNLLQSLDEETKQKLHFLKNQVEQRKIISETNKNKLNCNSYNQSYDALCKFEEALGLSDLAKAFCKSQAMKYKIKSMLHS